MRRTSLFFFERYSLHFPYLPFLLLLTNNEDLSMNSTVLTRRSASTKLCCDLGMTKCLFWGSLKTFDLARLALPIIHKSPEHSSL